MAFKIGDKVKYVGQLPENSLENREMITNGIGTVVSINGAHSENGYVKGLCEVVYEDYNWECDFYENELEVVDSTDNLEEGDVVRITAKNNPNDVNKMLDGTIAYISVVQDGYYKYILRDLETDKWYGKFHPSEITRYTPPNPLYDWLCIK